MPPLLIPTVSRDSFVVRFIISVGITILVLVGGFISFQKEGLTMITFASILAGAVMLFASKQYYALICSLKDGDSGMYLDERGISLQNYNLYTLADSYIPWNNIAGCTLETVRVKYSSVTYVCLTLLHPVNTVSQTESVQLLPNSFSTLRFPAHFFAMSSEEMRDVIQRYVDHHSTIT